MDSFWDLCQERFRASLTQQQFSTWIKPLVFEDAGGEVRILAPNHFVMDWVREKFAEHIDAWAQEFYARHSTVLAVLIVTFLFAIIHVPQYSTGASGTRPCIAARRSCGLLPT